MNFIEKWLFKRGIRKAKRKMYDCMDGETGDVDWKKYFQD